MGLLRGGVKFFQESADTIKINLEDENGDGEELSSLKSICLEARYTLSNQIDILNEIDTKATQLFRANILLAALVASALSLTTRTDLSFGNFLSNHSIAGFIFLLYSIVFAAITYSISTFDEGIGWNDIVDKLESNDSLTEHYKKLAKGYANWIQYNQKVILINSAIFNLTLMNTINAVLFFSSAFWVGITGYTFPVSTLIYFIVAITAIAIDLVIFHIDTWTENIAKQGLEYRDSV